MAKGTKKIKIGKESSLNLNGDSFLLIGNWGYKNLGDELILLGNIKLLLSQGKKVTVACNNPEWLRNFFAQFIDISKVDFINELPKGFRSSLRYVFKYGMKGFWRFCSVDTVIIGGGEILTEENPGAYRYWRVSIWPFLWKKKIQALFKQKNKSDLYIMGGVQVPRSKYKKHQLLRLLKYTTACYLRDFDAVDEIKPYVDDSTFFMDTSYFAYDREKVSLRGDDRIEMPYIIINLNKNAESFFDELVQDIKHYCDIDYRIYYVPVAKGENTYYDDLQYAQRLEKALGEDVDFALLDWESDFDYFVKVLKGAKKVFSSRLHLYLIASFLGCDTKVYPYQRKILKMEKIINDLL